MWQLFTLVFMASALTCPKYSCTKSTSTIGSCIAHSSKSGKDEYTITPCEVSLHCPFSPGSSSQCSNYPAQTRYPGDYCQTNLDCLSLNCTGSVCLGLTGKSQLACQSTADCEPGFYCSNTKCMGHKSKGESCTLDEQCPNSNVCDQGFCVLMFSLDNGKITNVTWGSFAPACASGFAVKSQTVAAYNCTTAPRSQSQGLTPCPTDGLCIATDSTSQQCQCGYAEKAYCPLFEGDDPVVSMIAAWKKLFSISENYCNGLHKWSFGCFYALQYVNNQYYVDFLAWSINATKYFNGTWYKEVNAPQCVRETILLSFKNLEYDYQKAESGIIQCPGYYEVTDTTGWASNQCVYYTKNVYSGSLLDLHLVHGCAKGLFCSVQQQYNSSCLPWEESPGLPGDYCKKGTDCYSGSCSKNRCTGQAEGQTCNTTEQNIYYCGLGLFCNTTSYLCQSINTLSSCSGDSQCNSSSICLFGKCTLRFSVPNGKEGYVTYGSGFGFSESCASGFAYLDTLSGQILCGTPPVTDGTPLSQCVGGSIFDKNGTFSQGCECGLSGNAYYPAFTGDGKYLAEVIKYYKRFSAKVGCYNNDWSARCLKFKSDYLYDYYQYYTNFELLTNGPYNKNSVKGIAKLFAAEYYNATEYISDESSSSSSSGAAWVIAGLGLYLIA